MKKLLKLVLAALVFTMAFTAVELKAQDSDIGLTVGVDYMSNYISKGKYVFSGNSGNGGAFFPYASYDVLSSGLSVTVMGELSEVYFGNSKEEKIGALPLPWRAILKEQQTLDFNLEYEYKFENLMTINAGIWYYWYKTLTGVNLLETRIGNPSYFDLYTSIAVDAVPFVTPLVKFTYMYQIDDDYYFDGASRSDFYVQAGIQKSIELTKTIFLDLGALVGLLHERQNKDSSTLDISDIDLSAGLTKKAGILTFAGSFHYIIVPGTQYKYASFFGIDFKDINRFYAQFGVSCNI